MLNLMSWIQSFSALTLRFLLWLKEMYESENAVLCPRMTYTKGNMYKERCLRTDP